MRDTDTDTEAAGPPTTPQTKPSSAADWTGGLDEAGRALVAAKGWKGPADAVRSYAHAERLIGRDPASLVPLPGADADDEAWAAFHTRAGRPENPDGYGFGRGEADRRLADRAHALGLTPRQASLFRAQARETQKAAEAEWTATLNQRHAGAVAELRREWGAEFERNDALALRALDYAGGPDLARTVVETGLSGDPDFVRALARLGGLLAEDGMVGGGGGGFSRNPASAQAEIRALQGDPSFMTAYQDAEHAGHADAVNRMRHLFATAHEGEM
ncbi:MAG: hypothetical protein ACTS3R_07785 [Inquilinaceae bacterium]